MEYPRTRGLVNFSIIAKVFGKSTSWVNGIRHIVDLPDDREVQRSGSPQSVDFRHFVDMYWVFFLRKADLNYPTIKKVVKAYPKGDLEDFRVKLIPGVDLSIDKRRIILDAKRLFQEALELQEKK